MCAHPSQSQHISPEHHCSLPQRRHYTSPYVPFKSHRRNYRTISINPSSETIVGGGVALLDEPTHSSKPIAGTVNYLIQPITVEWLLAEVDRIASAGVIKLDELTIHVHQGRL